jgi:hypothetical protein
MKYIPFIFLTQCILLIVDKAVYATIVVRRWYTREIFKARFALLQPTLHCITCITLLHVLHVLLHCFVLTYILLVTKSVRNTNVA